MRLFSFFKRPSPDLLICSHTTARVPVSSVQASNRTEMQGLCANCVAKEEERLHSGAEMAVWLIEFNNTQPYI